MNEPDFSRTHAALARARNAYVFAFLLMLAFWLLSYRSGYRMAHTIVDGRVGSIRLVCDNRVNAITITLGVLEPLEQQADRRIPRNG